MPNARWSHKWTMVALFILACSALSRPSRAQTQRVIPGHPIPYKCTGTCPPPTVAFSPSFITDTLPTVTETVTICGSSLGLDTAYFNGVKGAGFVASGCEVSTGTYPLNVGTNTATGVGCASLQGPCGRGSTTITHPWLAVQPKGGHDIVSLATTATETMYISNYSGSATTFTLALTCTGSITSCSGVPATINVPAHSHSPVNVTFNTNDTNNTTGTVKLKASVGSTVDSALMTIELAGQMRVTLSDPALDHSANRCAYQCFANKLSMTTPSYISLDAPRAVTLVYNSDRVAVRPIIGAFVSHQGTDTITDVQLTAQLYNPTTSAWSSINFVNSDANFILHFDPAPFMRDAGTYQINGVADASTYFLAGNDLRDAVYKERVEVTIVYKNGHIEQQMDSTHLMLVNERGSPVANGWEIAGVSRHSWGIGSPADQTYIMQADMDGSTRLFGPLQCSAPGCVWPSPPGANIDTRFHYDNQPWSRVDMPDSSQEVYYPNGYIWMRIGRMQDTIVYTYDTVHVNGQALYRVIQISDPFRLQPNTTVHTYWTIQYGATGISAIIEPGRDGTPGGGRKTLVNVNSSGQLTSWTDPDHVATQFGYDAQNRLISETDRGNNVTQFRYEGQAWKVDSIITPVVQIDTNSTGNLVTGSLVTINSDPQLLGMAQSATSMASPAEPIRTDTAWGYVINTAKHATHFQLDLWGQISVYDTPYGYVTTYQHDANGFPSVTTNSGGRSDELFYSGAFLLASNPEGGLSTQFTYGAFGQVTQASGQDQASKNFGIGKRGHIDYMSISNATTHYYADALGRDTSMVDPLGNTTRYHYDLRTGNQDSVTMTPSDRYTAKVFDAFGRDSIVYVSGNGPTGKTTTAYDSLNRVIAVYDGVHTQPTQHIWDAMRETQTVDQGGQAYATTFNAIGWPLTHTDPIGRTATTTYNGFGLPATVTTVANQRLAYYYDRVGRQVSVHRQSARSGEVDLVDSTSYTLFGDTIINSNGISTEANYYERTIGRLDSTVTTYHGNHVFKKAITYDSAGRTHVVTWSTRNVTGIDLFQRAYYYDRLTQALDSIKIGSTAVGLRYDAAFNRDSVLYPGVTRVDTISPSHLLVATTFTAASVNALAQSYAYDSAGRLVEQSAGGVNSERFDYNSLGQLLDYRIGHYQGTNPCATHHTGDYPCESYTTFVPTLTETYGYDASYGLDTLTDSAAAQLLGTFNTGDRLKTWGNETFVNDTNGNRQSLTAGSAIVTYAWGADGRLLAITEGSTVRGYDYDANGRMVRRTLNGLPERYYLWDGDQLVAILDSAANARVKEFVYFPNATDKPLAVITGPVGGATIHYLNQDAAGNVTGQHSNGTLEQQITYDPWGNVTSATAATDTTALRWKGLLWEGGVTNMYYARARWYDPESHRFISPDPGGLAGGINKFAYANNDPVNGLDPSGLKYYVLNCTSQEVDVIVNGTYYGTYTANVCADSEVNEDSLPNGVYFGCRAVAVFTFAGHCGVQVVSDQIGHEMTIYELLPQGSPLDTQWNGYPTQNTEFNDNYNAQYNWVYLPDANAQAVINGILATEQSPQWDGTPYPFMGIGPNSNTFICTALQASGTMLPALWFAKGTGSPLATRIYPFMGANGAKCID